MASVRPAAAALPNPGAAAADPQREFAFSKGDFEFLAALAYKRAGISLSDSKRNLVYGRLSRRLRALGLTSFGEYRQYLESGDDSEIERFINSISTNHTKFFREAHHFTHLRGTVVTSRMIYATVQQPNSVAVAASTGELPGALSRLRCQPAAAFAEATRVT